MAETSPTVDVTGITLEHCKDYQEMSACVDGDKIWFRFPLFLEIEPRAELFLVPAMLESMVRGVPVHIKDDIEISDQLAHMYREIQAVLKSWNDDFLIAPLQAKTRKNFPVTDNIICCFSGGIDSTYTFGHFRDDITHLLLVKAFENWDKENSWEKNMADRKAFALSQNKKIITVDTNIRAYCDARKFEFSLVHGSLLSVIGITLNPKVMLIPSSYSYTTLHPHGSHPLLDPLWATENTHIIHHGCAASRCEKTEYIAEDQILLDQLQVCWKSSYNNCGECPKCLRTSLALKIMGKKCARLPEPTGADPYKQLALNDAQGLYFLEELVELCKANDNTDIRSHLERIIRTFKIKVFFHNIAKFILGSPGRKLSRLFRKNAWYTARASTLSNRVD
ncbi:hypothetical protein [Paremcibacter congregatus]|uniref:hypothetical protein n=1 Tax=Paremcibacter congregatus TaxID=2043170 RepID=UPI0030ED7E14